MQTLTSAVRSAAGSAFLLTLFALVCSQWYPAGFLGNDSRQYLEFSDSILNGTFFLPAGAVTRAEGELLRSPGFPLILTLGRLGEILTVEQGLIVGHSILFFFSTWFLLSQLSRIISPLLSLPLIAGTVLLNLEFFGSLVSEWGAFCGILALFASILKFRTFPTLASLLSLSIVCGALILIREALLGALLIPFICLYAQNQLRASLRLYIASSGGIMLLLCWMLLNLYRIGSFELSQKTGFALFNVGSYLGPVQTTKGTQEQLSFYQFINLNQQAATDDELRESYLVPNPRLEAKAGYNYDVAYKYGKDHKLAWTEIDSLMEAYALHAIQEHFNRYLTFFWHALGSILYSVPLLLFGLLPTLLRDKLNLPPTLVHLSHMGIVLHLLHILLILTHQSLSLRYYTLTAFPAYLALFLCWGALLLPQRFRPQLSPSSTNL